MKTAEKQMEEEFQKDLRLIREKAATSSLLAKLLLRGIAYGAEKLDKLLLRLL